MPYKSDIINSVMPSIKEKLEKSKSFVLYFHNIWIFASLGSFLATVVLFGSIELSGLFGSQNRVGVHVVNASFETNLSGVDGAYVGSKTGKSYYFPWCGTVNRIKDANLV